MNTEKERKLLKKRDAVVIGLVVLLCAGALVWMALPKSTAAAVAQISADGRVVKSIELAAASDGTFGIGENPKVQFEVRGRRIRFVDTDCPDKLCENVGFIDTPNQIAVCLPNRVSLKIVAANGEAGVDAVT